MRDKDIDYKRLFDGFITNVWLEDTANPQYDGDVPQKQSLYFGVIIKIFQL